MKRNSKNALMAGRMAALGLTGIEVAERAGISVQSLSAVLNYRRIPRSETALRIAIALECEPEELGLPVVRRGKVAPGGKELFEL